jgi:hypothetical protein
VIWGRSVFKLSPRRDSSVIASLYPKAVARGGMIAALSSGRGMVNRPVIVSAGSASSVIPRVR